MKLIELEKGKFVNPEAVTAILTYNDPAYPCWGVDIPETFGVKVHFRGSDKPIYIRTNSVEESEQKSKDVAVLLGFL